MMFPEAVGFMNVLVDLDGYFFLKDGMLLKMDLMRH